MTIELRDVTVDNFKQVIDLQTRPEQAGRVAPNVHSLAQAKVDPIRRPFAVYSDDTLVGFVMFDGQGIDGRYRVSRLMIDQAHQGKGHGRATMVEVLRRIKEQPDCREIVLDYTPDNIDARSLYLSLGFEEVGPVEGGECILARLEVR